LLNTYGGIPDDVPNKSYYPISRNIWQLYQKLGWNWLDTRLNDTVGNFYEVVKTRLDESIYTAKALSEGKIQEASKIFTYFFFPPVLMMRNDLQVGTTKLLYGDSIDVSYVAILDNINEIGFVLNCHGEAGLPVDFWYVGVNDELLDRRHRKLGIKFRKLTKLKNLVQMGLKSIDILKDIRNERTPQWSQSPYHIIMVYGLGLTNAGLEISNFENIAYIYDGVNYDKWGFPDANFTFAPFPAFLKMLFMMDRAGFTKKFAGLSAESKLYCHHMLEKAFPMDWFMENYTECYQMWLDNWSEVGIPFPSTSLNVKFPDKKVLKEGMENFNRTYNSDPRIFAKDIGLTAEEALNGVFLDVNHLTKPRKLTPDDKISTGCGMSTKVCK